MFDYVLKKFVGTKNQRELKRMQPLVGRINEREGWAKSLSDEQIREQVRAWRKEVADAPPLQKSDALSASCRTASPSPASRACASSGCATSTSS